MMDEFARAMREAYLQDPKPFDTAQEALLDRILAARAKPHRRVAVNETAVVGVPPDILAAAETLHRFFAERGIEDWKLGNVQSRRGAGQ